MRARLLRSLKVLTPMPEVYLEDLFNAVVERAAEDYLKALCDLHAAKLYDYKRGVYGEISDLERFFHGDVECFTRLDGEMLLERLRKFAHTYNYDWVKIKKARAGV